MTQNYTKRTARRNLRITKLKINHLQFKKNAQKYHAQMQDYEFALLSLGYSSVKKVLLYIQEQEVEVLK